MLIPPYFLVFKIFQEKEWTNVCINTEKSKKFVNSGIPGFSYLLENTYIYVFSRTSNTEWFS